jgi:D-alanine-D-alanine ligase
VLGNDDPEASVVGEIVPGHEFYDYEDKYFDDAVQLVIPAQLPEATADRVRELAVAAFRAIDARGMARVDFFLEAGTERLYLNEINTIPGFTRVSMYPRLWMASGVPFPELCDQLIELALESRDQRAALKRTR